MLKMIVTGAIVSKGYNENPAIRFFDNEKGGQTATFRIGQKVFDSRAENNHRWINLIARYDEDSWEDRETGAPRTAPVLILDEIEYSGSGGGQKNGKNANGEVGGTEDPSADASDQPSGTPSQRMGYQPSSQPAPSLPGNFTGYENFGSQENPYF